MTAGRDSRGLKSALHKHYALVNLSTNSLTFYSLAVSLQIRQTREELARQPDLHHRVVFLQPPPSFDGGLDSQSLYLVIWFFNCPTKAIMLFSYNGESSCALFSQTYKTPFHFQAGLTPQDATRINFCPCGNSWMKSFLGRLLLLYLIARFSSFCTHGAAFYLVFAGFCWLPSKRSRSSSSIRCKHSGSKRRTPQIVKYCDWLNNLAFSFWVRTCIFRSPLKCGILKV